ncbi:MAG: DUF6231 family protein [Pseudomonadota bacterium]
MISYNRGNSCFSHKHFMSYPADIYFDIETLVNVAQPTSILVLGDIGVEFLEEYQQQRSVISQECTVTHLPSAEISQIEGLLQRFDVGIAAGLFEHLDKHQGAQVLSKLRDVLTAQYCVGLPLSTNPDQDGWQLTDLFSYALKRVNSYAQVDKEYGLFSYNISDYKKTPDWLNADNWANPEMWGKYWW